MMSSNPTKDRDDDPAMVIARNLIPCSCGGFGENKRLHLTDCPRSHTEPADIAEAIRAAENRGKESIKELPADLHREWPALFDLRKDQKVPKWTDLSPLPCTNCGTVALSEDAYMFARQCIIEKFNPEPVQMFGTPSKLASGELIFKDANLQFLYLPHPGAALAVRTGFSFVRDYAWDTIGDYYSTAEAAKREAEKQLKEKYAAQNKEKNADNSAVD